MSGAGSGARRASLPERAAELARELERARFGGANPAVVVPPDADALEVAARVLAAERANAPLRVAGRDYNTRQDLAASTLERALGALRNGSFASAQELLDAAGARAADPTLQQRIGLWKLLVQVVRRLVRADPDEELRGNPGRLVLEHLEGADRLPAAERKHYRDEVERLVRLHAAARAGEHDEDGRLARTLWYLLRVRLALAQEEPVLALAWCVRAARTNVDRLTPDEYLGGLLDQARRYVLLQLGELPEDPLADARDAVKGLQAWDVYRALAAQLGRAWDLDVHRETARFSIAPYQDVEA